MDGLRSIVKATITREIVEGTDYQPKHVNNGHEDKPTNWRVLVLDKIATKIISSCCKVSEVAYQGITLMEDLTKVRQPLPGLEAVYILQSNEESMDYLLKDLNSPKANYKAFHIFFLDMCPDASFEKLTQVKHKHAIKTLKELNISFIPEESHVFHLDAEQSMKAYFSDASTTSPDERLKAMEGVAERLATVLATLEEFPRVRYRSGFVRNEEFAEVVVSALEKYKNSNPLMGTKTRSQLIIVDRGFDCVSPLLHEITFQAMVHDLLDMKDSVCTYKTGNGKTKSVILDDDDALWQSLKGKNIAQVMTEIPTLCQDQIKLKRKFDEHIRKNLGKLIKHVPELERQLTSLAAQLNIAEQCDKAFKKIKPICDLEQNLATTVRADGDNVNSSNPMMMLMGQEKETGFLLGSKKDSVYTDFERLRLLLLYIMFRKGISDASVKHLFKRTGLPENLKCIVTNLELLGQTMIVEEADRRKVPTQPQFRRKSEVEDESQYVLARWVPMLKDVMQYAVEESLDRELFPTMSGKTEMDNSKPIVSARIGKSNMKTRHRIFIFVMGGMTYSETRSVYEMNKAQDKYEFLIGSTHIITPNRFLEDLQSL